MSDALATEHQPDLHHLLSAAGYRIIVAKIHAEVVPPHITDPDLIADYVAAAIASIASMLPANMEEAETALRVVRADAQASDAIRHARAHFNDPTPAMKCQAQAALMMRTANAARSLLMRIQTGRRKRDANPTAAHQDAWTEHCAAGFLTAARDGTPAPKPPPPPPPPPEPDPAPPANDDKFAQCDEAEQYALLHPRRAAEIRYHGGLPPGATYGPPDLKLMLQIISSTSPILQQVDKDYPQS